MHIDFRQGIVTYPISRGDQTFLIPNKTFITLQATINDRVDITIAHGDTDYLITENITTIDAWGPFRRDVDYWLYWDINKTTGFRTFGSTTLEPIVSSLEPAAVTNQHWFNTTTNKMHVYQHGGWREVLRLFAAKVHNDDIFPLGNVNGAPFAGSQVGLNTPVAAGRLQFDMTGLPILLSNGTFLTTEDDMYVDNAPINEIRLEANVVDVIANENIAKFQIVKFTDFDYVNLAGYNELQTTLIGITLTDMLFHQHGKVCLTGVVINPAWDFSNIGGMLWVTDNGLLTEIDNHLIDPNNHLDAKFPVGQILTPTSILFTQGIGGVGARGANALTVPLATEAIQGIARLSLPASDPNNPIVVETNDPRLLPYIHPATHPATMITTNAYNFLTGTDVQVQLHELADRDLNSLSNVNANPAPSNALTWNGVEWVASAVSTSQSLQNLLDVNLTNPITTGQQLIYNGTNWINVTPTVTLTGDLLGTGSTTIPTTLATVNNNVGTFGDSTHVAQFTVNAKGLITSVTNVPIAFPPPSGTGIISVDMAVGGPIWTWGVNWYGQLGVGDIIDRSSPVQVGSLTDWAQISTGAHTMAIRKNGSLWAWGYNTSGALGLGDVNHRSIPVQVGSLTDWAVVAAGDIFTLAIKKDGSLWTWGQNTYGQLGVGDTIHRSSPVQVGSLTDWKQVMGGTWFAAAVKNDGTLWTWGRNNFGQLGQGDLISRSSPVQVGSLTNWATASIGYLAIAGIKQDGTLWTWGYNLRGQLGHNDTVHRSSPTQVGALTNWKTVDASFENMIALKTDNTLWTWGDNYFGQLGVGDHLYRSSPVQIGMFTAWDSIYATQWSTFAISDNGELFACGYNDYGSLGFGDSLTGGAGGRSYLTQIGSLTSWYGAGTRSTSNGGYPAASFIQQDLTYSGGPVTTSGVITLGGVLNISNGGTSAATPNEAFNNLAPLQYTSRYASNMWTCGYNFFGQLGLDVSREQDRSSPILVGNTPGWKQASASFSSTAAVKYDGTLWAWGRNNNGQLGLGDLISRSSPVQIGALTNWAQIAVGQYNTAAIKTDGTLWTWGLNNFGQLGDAYASNRSSPVQVGAWTTWKQVAVHNHMVAAIKTDGTLWTWGKNGGELGLGDTIHRSSPTQVGSLTNWKQVSCGISHMAAIKTDGTLWTWGSNFEGQLGTNNTTSLSSPVQIGSLTNWAYVSASTNTTAAVKTDGTLWIWGANYQGQLGLNLADTVKVSSPVQIGSLTNWKTVTCGDECTMAIRMDGTAWSWGDNAHGQLGLGDTINRFIPVQMPQPQPNYNNVETSSDWINLSVDAGDHFAIFSETYNPASNAGDFLTTDGTNTSWVPLNVDPTLSAWVWGNNLNFSLGLRVQIMQNNASSPMLLRSATSWTELACGYYHGVGVKSDGTLWTWGYNQYGQIGVGDSGLPQKSYPVQVNPATNWAQASAGYYSTYAIKQDGTLWTWGQNNLGQLGDGTTVDKSIPVQIGSLTNWKQIVAGGQNVAAIKTDGTLWTWGYNNGGSLGDGTTTSKSSPVQIGSLTNWRAVACAQSSSYMLAIKNDGTLWAWGTNAAGQLGDGTTTSTSSPIQIGSLNDWFSVAISVGSTSHAIKDNGTLWSWGSNSNGTIGDNTLVSKSSPIQIGTLNNWKQLCGNWNSITAIKNNGTMWAWGWNTHGEVGIGLSGAAGRVSSPVQIGALTTWVGLSTTAIGSRGMALQLDPPAFVYPISHGGTGQSTAAGAINALLPSQVGNAGKVLSTDGTNLRWVAKSSIIV